MVELLYKDEVYALIGAAMNDLEWKRMAATKHRHDPTRRTIKYIRED
jgi:hypothetical protein